MTSMGSRRKNNFSPGGPPHQHIAPPKSPYWQKCHYFEKWGLLEEKVGRQGKSAQNDRNELNNAPIFSWVNIIGCSAEIRVSKLKISKNDTYFNRIFSRGMPTMKRGKICVIFGNFEI